MENDMARTDEHRPSAIIPADYEFVTCQHEMIAMPAASNWVLQFRMHMERTGGRYSQHEHGGGCHICGANFLYGAIFYHAKSNTYIKTGFDCAEKLEMGDAAAFRSFRDDVRTAKLEADAKAELDARGLGLVWQMHKNVGEFLVGKGDLPKHVEIAIDVVRKLIRFGSLSQAQYDLLQRIVSQHAEKTQRAAQRAAEDDAALPIPAELVGTRAVIEGVILTVKMQETDFGMVTKVLVKHADGWKLWGTRPSDLPAEVVAGSRISFTARIEKSDKDDKFGFFSRPTKARVVA
jgi:hypothetical protein